LTFFTLPLPPASHLFPYTTLFRSRIRDVLRPAGRGRRARTGPVEAAPTPAAGAVRTAGARGNALGRPARRRGDRRGGAARTGRGGPAQAAGAEGRCRGRGCRRCADGFPHSTIRCADGPPLSRDAGERHRWATCGGR